ncbi:uncharacterized protein LOC135108115 isoform X3 [Scylla paramamosain]|uniref:uncharacterized protein LOC135108115 isoform X3 n=1 Tax=Scylla paramamosain TaxID=85552 RepID=UPI0030838851
MDASTFGQRSRMAEVDSGKMEELNIQRSTTKRKFTRKINIFKESVLQEDPIPVLQHSYDEFMNPTTRSESSWRQSICGWSYRLQMTQHCQIQSFLWTQQHQQKKVGWLQHHCWWKAVVLLEALTLL